MSGSVKWILASVFLVLALGGILYREVFGPPAVVWRSQIREGNELIVQIDGFQRSHGIVPSALAEIGIHAKGRDRFFYEKCDDTRYIVWFGTTLGESMAYDSRSRRWADINVVCR